jgi:hypothetical protein
VLGTVLPAASHLRPVLTVQSAADVHEVHERWTTSLLHVVEAADGQVLGGGA